MTSDLNRKFAPSPWAYQYNPYIAQHGGEIPAYEVFDRDGNKVFDTNEDTDAGLQEANACLGSLAPELLGALDHVRATLRLCRLDKASDTQIEEAIVLINQVLGRAGLA
jgi:hypothetical protein